VKTGLDSSKNVGELSMGGTTIVTIRHRNLIQTGKDTSGWRRTTELPEKDGDGKGFKTGALKVPRRGGGKSGQELGGGQSFGKRGENLRGVLANIQKDQADPYSARMDRGGKQT